MMTYGLATVIVAPLAARWADRIGRHGLFVGVGGMVSGLLPVVGVPMPLMSYGGTSAVSLLAGFGILMSVHAHRKLMGP